MPLAFRLTPTSQFRGSSAGIAAPLMLRSRSIRRSGSARPISLPCLDGHVCAWAAWLTFGRSDCARFARALIAVLSREICSTRRSAWVSLISASCSPHLRRDGLWTAEHSWRGLRRRGQTSPHWAPRRRAASTQTAQYLIGRQHIGQQTGGCLARFDFGTQAGNCPVGSVASGLPEQGRDHTQCHLILHRDRAGRNARFWCPTPRSTKSQRHSRNEDVHLGPDLRLMERRADGETSLSGGVWHALVRQDPLPNDVMTFYRGVHLCRPQQCRWKWRGT